MVSGLASSIRSAAEGATFDLAGLDTPSMRSLVSDAFSSPLPLLSTIRITLVVGGGRSSRQKYDARAMQAVTSTLKSIEYAEDRGASVSMVEGGGCFKTQHDTGRNIYTVVVFPRVAGGDGDREGDGADGCGDHTGNDDEPLIPLNSPGYKIAVCDLKTFPNLLLTYCPTYLEKRECLRCLEGLLQVEQAIENKMMHGHPLDGGEKNFYDESSHLKEKHALVQREVGRHIEEGRLTVEEKGVLVEMNERRIASLMEEKSSSAVAEKLKRALARKQQLQSLTDGVLLMAAGAYPPPLRHEKQIVALRKKLLPLRKLEESSRRRFLTLAEMRSLAEKEEVESEILHLEEVSRGWFEEDDAFKERIQRSRDAFDENYSCAKQAGGRASAAMQTGMGNSIAGVVNKWILPGEKPKGTWKAGDKSKLKSKRAGAVFSAMMMDSSSDEEDEEENENDLEVTVYSAQQRKQQHITSFNFLFPEKAAAGRASKRGSTLKLPSTVKESNNPTPADGESEGVEKELVSVEQPQPKIGKKKKKKKGKKNKRSVQVNEVLEEDGEGGEVSQFIEIPTATKDVPSSVSDSLLQFWRLFLLPFMLAILRLIWSLVTSALALVASAFVGEKSRGDEKKKRG